MSLRTVTDERARRFASAVSSTWLICDLFRQPFYSIESDDLPLLLGSFS